MADFIKAQEFVKIVEGGYQKQTNDNGNWTGGKIGVGNLIGTNHGISAPTLGRYLGRTATESEMKNLSYATALTIYKNYYWKPIKGDSITNQNVATVIYDGMVQGEVHIRTALSKALSNMGVSVSSNNVFTDATIILINKLNPKTLFEQIKKQREILYRSYGGSWLQGWLSRLGKLAYEGEVIVVKNRFPLIVSAVLIISAFVIIYYYNKRQIIKVLA